MDADFDHADRGPLGVRLRLADLAAGLRIRRAAAGQHRRHASVAVHLFVRSSRHAGTARPRARPRFRRRLPRHRLSGGSEASGRRRSTICAAASRPRRSTGSWCAASGSKAQPDRRVEALCYAVDRGHPQYAGRLTHERQLHIVRQGHGRSGNNRDYVLETVKSLEALNILDHDLQVLAERLKGSQDAHT